MKCKYFVIEDIVYIVPNFTADAIDRYVIKVNNINRGKIYYNKIELFDQAIHRHSHCKTPFGRYHSHE